MLIGLALLRKVTNALGLVTVGLLMSLWMENAPADTTASLLIGTAWTADSDVRYAPNDSSGTLSTDALTHHLNFGVGFDF